MLECTSCGLGSTGGYNCKIEDNKISNVIVNQFRAVIKGRNP